jgi:hypothetical protein
MARIVFPSARRLRQGIGRGEMHAPFWPKGARLSEEKCGRIITDFSRRALLPADGRNPAFPLFFGISGISSRFLAAKVEDSFVLGGIFVITSFSRSITEFSSIF